MNKLLIIATFIILTANNLQAQQYDTYGKSQATREWQETERHYNSMKQGNKTSSSTISGDYNAYGWGDNSKIQQQEEAARRQDARWKEWYDKVDKLEALIKSRNLKREPAYFYQLQTAAKEAGFSDYDISVFFGYSAQEYKEKLLKRIREKSGAAVAERINVEFEKNMEKTRKEKEDGIKAREEMIKVEIANFAKNWQTATSLDYSIDLREKAFKAMKEYIDPILIQVRKDYNGYKGPTNLIPVENGEKSLQSIQLQKNIFYKQSKQFKSAYLNGNVNTHNLNTDGIAYCANNFVFAGLIVENNPTPVMLEKAAYAYKLSEKYINLFAYTLFLDNNIDGAIDALQKHIDKHPDDTTSRIEYLNKLILLKIKQGKDEEALNLFKSNSSLAIKDKNELIDFISLDIISTLKKCIALDEKSLYYVYPTSTLMDIDLLVLVQPGNETVLQFRKKLGGILNCQRYLSPINELFINQARQNSNTTALIEQLTTSGSMAPELEDAANYIGFPLHIPNKKDYEIELAELKKFNKKNLDGNNDINILNGYLIISHPSYVSKKNTYKTIYKIEDIDKASIIYYNEVNIILKPEKYYFYPNAKNTDWVRKIKEENTVIKYESKDKAAKALILFEALLKKIQKK